MVLACQQLPYFNHVCRLLAEMENFPLKQKAPFSSSVIEQCNCRVSRSYSATKRPLSEDLTNISNLLSLGQKWHTSDEVIVLGIVSMRIKVRQQALCCSSKINRSDPGRIIFIKQSQRWSNAKSVQGNNKYAGSTPEPKWQTGVRGHKKDSGKNNSARILRHRKLGQHKNNYLA